ncbi:IS5 family transposase [Marivita sp.]|uniref:IS5 family transposase n=1 Tax=Marivita sp. TaxID=2003365 RepID=UPI003B5C1AF5
MARSDMSDLEWEFIKAVLPRKTRGKKRVDDRRVINGIFYVLRTGIPWADLPEQYGPPTTVYNRFNRWSYAGHWDRIMEAIADAHNVDMVMIDGTSVRAHHSATTLKKRDPRRCLGRSRGGLGTKIHALTNQDGLPIRYELTPGQAHDAPPCKALLDNLQPGQHVLADKAYDADWIRDMIWEQGAIDVIPPKANRKLPAEFDAEIYRERNKIERFFGRLKASFRRIATRYEKTSRNFLSMIKLASVRLWIEFYESAA